MSLTRESSIQTLTRIYCYLRLSGVPESATGAHLQESATNTAPGDLWTQLDARILVAQARGELGYPRVAGPPPLQRGHVHYPDR